MNQLVSRLNFEDLSVSSTIVLNVPYNSATLEEPVFVNVYCYGFTTISGSIKRFCFVLPIIYYSKSGDYDSIPTDAFLYDSANFTHMELADIGASLADFQVGVYPQSGGGGLNIEITPPSSGTDWDIYTYMDIYKQI